MDGLPRLFYLFGCVGAVLSISAPSWAASGVEIAQTMPTMGSVTAPLNATPAEPLRPINLEPEISPALQSGIEEDYRLGPGDIVQVEVFNVPEYSGRYQVATDGNLSLPTVGRVQVANLSPQQAGDAIAARYVSDLRFPIVSVSVLERRPLRISVIGEITQPGLYTLPASQGTQYPTVFQMLQTAGGVTQAANLRNIEIRRRNGDGTQTRLKVDMMALLEQGDTSQNLFLRDDDTIVVAAAPTVEMANLSQLAVSNLRASSTLPVDVAIVGEVSRPGPYRLGGESDRPSIVKAIQEAGGITTTADLREVELRRRTRQGGEQIIRVDLWDMIQQGDLSQDLLLQTGDVLRVPTARAMTVSEITALTTSSLSTGIIRVNIIGEVESPGQLEVQANTSLNQALLSAGGLNNRARQQTTLIRFNPNGSVTQQAIDVDLAQEVNSAINPILQPNDVIVVGRNARAAFNDTLREFTGTFNLIWPFVLLGL